MIENNPQSIRKLADSIRGSAKMLGGEQLEALAAFIANNADLGNELPSRELISHLDSCFDKFQDSLNIPKF